MHFLIIAICHNQKGSIRDFYQNPNGTFNLGAFVTAPFIMSQLDQTIAERVAEVAEDLELQADLKLSNKQLDELRITGRVTIDLVTIAPYLPKIIKYLHQSDDEDVVWSLIINTISGDADITLKGCQLML